MMLYNGKKMGALPPHVYATAEAAYLNVQRSDKNQSCVPPLQLVVAGLSPLALHQRHCITASLHRCITASLHHCTTAPYTVLSIDGSVALKSRSLANLALDVVELSLANPTSCIAGVGLLNLHQLTGPTSCICPSNIYCTQVCDFWRVRRWQNGDDEVHLAVRETYLR
jgi:hypothetical protein